jgi:hypothetical protein
VRRRPMTRGLAAAPESPMEARMTFVSRQHPAQGRRRRRVAAAAIVAPALVGCGTAAPPVPLPARPSAAPAVAASTPAAGSPRQRVLAALVGYNAALSEADKSRNQAAARRLLQPYLAASRIDGVVQTMSGIWAQREVFFGQDVLHVLSVTISGESAFVHDCDDTSGMGLAYQATGELVPGSAGIAELNIVTSLTLVGGRWLVQSQLIEDVPCTP